MKTLTVLLCLIVLTTLSAKLWQQSADSRQTTTKMQQQVTAPPVLLEKEPLSLETRWLTLQTERENKKNAAKQPSSTAKSNQKILSIGDKNYQLYGIFSAQKGPFILLKGEDKSLIKLLKGATLNNRILFDITSSSIIFSQDQQLIEFKLFEPKNDETTQK